MHGLKKIKSQQLLDRLFSTSTRQNYYQHHNMPARTNYRGFMKSTHASSTTHFSNGNTQKNRIQIGRELYPQVVKRIQDPGPGSYADNFTSTQAKGYRFNIRSRSAHRKIIPVKSRETRIGPGTYNYDTPSTINLLSKTRKTAVPNFSKSPQKKQRLVFSIPHVPGPGQYQNFQNINKISSHLQSNSHKISMTARSNIINTNQLPGPGYYRWDQYYQKNKEKKKPAIQYKFVYGHPS